ncbi:hypothetical protein ONS96_011709 [Cadophora gregata f. sp. sojae]|nr:hypothetical protein ONS96_011709 [Cadophora gregata f. sp. sojae]
MTDVLSASTRLPTYGLHTHMSASQIPVGFARNAVGHGDPQETGTLPTEQSTYFDRIGLGFRRRRNIDHTSAGTLVLRSGGDTSKHYVTLRDAQRWAQNLPRKLKSMHVPIKTQKVLLKFESVSETLSRRTMPTPDASLANSHEIPQPGFEVLCGIISTPEIPQDDHLSSNGPEPDEAAYAREELRCRPESQDIDLCEGRPNTPPRESPATLQPLRTELGPDQGLVTLDIGAPIIGPELSLIQSESISSDWTKIERLRTKIWGHRSRVQEARSVLRLKQQVKAVADDRYIQYVRLHGHGIIFGDHTLSDEQAEVSKLFQACEEARQEYGPLEDNCNALESDLTVLEFQLDCLERKFYDRSSQHPTSLTANYDSTHRSAKQISSSSSDSGSEEAQEYHPLVSQYLSKLGDVDIYRERLDELLEERYILEEEMEKRARVGLRLSDENEQWLANYSQVEAGLIDDLENAENEAEKLKRDCLKQNLVDEDGEPTDQEYQEKLTFAEELNDAGRNEVSEYVKYPTLLPSPETKLAKSLPTSILFADDAAHIQSVRVNWWILEQVRRSAMEVELLARTHETYHDQITSREKWQTDVLQVWYEDGAQDDWLSARASSLVKTMAPVGTGRTSSISSEDSSSNVCKPASQQFLPRKSFSEDGSIDSRRSHPILNAPRPIHLVNKGL